MTKKQLKEGVKYDDGKPRHDLLPPDAVDGVAEVLAYGASKYAARNWEKGMDWGRLIAAQKRHLTAFELGEVYDEESGLPHLAHASCCALMLQALWMRGHGTDDRSEHLMVSQSPMTRKEYNAKMLREHANALMGSPDWQSDA